MELSRIQDVRVEQSLTQRLLGIGNITVETAGETGRVSMSNVDRPQDIADFILESAMEIMAASRLIRDRLSRAEPSENPRHFPAPCQISPSPPWSLSRLFSPAIAMQGLMTLSVGYKC